MMVKLFKDETVLINNAFLDRVSTGSIAGIKDMKQKYPSQLNINCTNNSGETPLIIAARRNDLDMVACLLEWGAVLSMKEPLRNRTAEFYAKKHENQAMLSLIQQYSCDSTASVSDPGSISSERARCK